MFVCHLSCCGKSVLDLCLGDGIDVNTSLPMAAAAAAGGSGQLFMMNLLVRSLMDDSVRLQLALESALRSEVSTGVTDGGCCSLDVSDPVSFTQLMLQLLQSVVTIALGNFVRKKTVEHMD